MTTTISALFDDYPTASRAVTDLESAGLPSDEISVVSNNAEGWYDRTDRTVMTDHPTRTTDRVVHTDAVDRDHHRVDDHTGAGAGTGAGVGAAVGGVAGVLAGLGLLAIPGIGPVVAAGWLVSLAAGAAVGGATGGIIGALTQSGVSEDEAHTYAEGVRRGGTLVTARVPETDEGRYRAILDRSAVKVRERETVYRNDGWTRYDPKAPAYSPDEIRGERERYRTRTSA